MNDSIKPSPQEREAALFALAIEKPAAQRVAFLQAVCGSDNALRQRLEALMAAHEQPNDALTAAGPPADAAMKIEFVDEPVGQAIGRYKLLEKVGEGGCGVVYVAEQTEPVRRRVALKVIKLGMDTKAVVARFEAERQALAMMDHPNIAKVLDAGATDTGRPYFVMELVRGIKITDYCDQQRLGTRERLDLFIRVCQAIQHAHQKGIIHRDIKPSNILVTLHDGIPVPKVIDFGIAKATEGRLSDATVYTQLHQFMGTPAYMSPEQAEMSGLDIDTRSDIYSLGVLLYQLLTSKTPFDANQLLALGIDEMRRTIREKEPMRPSTRLAALQKDELTTTAKRRSADAPKLIYLLKGDLDWIVMKCLEKDRSRRYDTATGLAADLKRHLNNEPVVARPPSAGYKFRKFARRNKTTFGVCAAFIALLLGAVVASTLAAIRANRAEALAAKRVLEVAEQRDAKERARKEAEAISAFLTRLFESPSPERDGRTITVVEVLDKAVRKLERDLATQPSRRARLQFTLGRTYEALGLDLEAIPLLEKSSEYHRSASGPEHYETLCSMASLAHSYSNVGRAAEALKLREAVLAGFLKTKGARDLEILEAMRYLALDHLKYGRAEEALRLSEELMQLQGEVRGPRHQETLAAMGLVAAAYFKLGKLDEALKRSEEVLSLRRQALGPEHRDTLRGMQNLAAVYTRLGRTNEALELNAAALALQRKTRGPESPTALKSMHSLVAAYARAGRLDEARRLGEESLAISRKVFGPEHRRTLAAMNSLAMIHRKAGRVDEAIQLAQSSLELHRRIVGPVSEGTLEAMTELATAHQAAGHLNEAIALEVESLRLKRQHLSPGHSALVDSINNLATCYEQSNRKAEAKTLRQELAELRSRPGSPDPNGDSTGLNDP